MGITDSNNLYRKISPDIITQNQQPKYTFWYRKKSNSGVIITSENHIVNGELDYLVWLQVLFYTR